MGKRVAIALSGGIDSTALLYYLNQQPDIDAVYGLFVDIGTPRSSAAWTKVRSQWSDKGWLAEEPTKVKLSFPSDREDAGILPLRRMVFASVLQSFAVSKSCDEAYLGWRNGVPPSATEQMQQVTQLLTLGIYQSRESVQLLAPLVGMTPAEVIELTGVPRDVVQQTVSCDYHTLTSPDPDCLKCKSREAWLEVYDGNH
jgi:7-cyano-7-deazaguanine synthase in queuosine biosynthesis